MNPVTTLCRQLRNNATPTEKILWEELRKRNIGGEKFLRQFPLFTLQGLGHKAFYIADFYSAAHKLVIEVDGPIHLLKKEYDDNRDIVMKEWGFTVLRFTNDEVINNLDKVIGEIAKHINIKRFLASFFNLFKAKIEQYNLNDKEISGLLGWLDDEDKQHFILKIDFDLSLIVDAKSLCDYLSNNNLITGDKIDITVSDLKFQLIKDGWEEDNTSRVINFISAFDVKMVDDGEETDSFYIHF